MRVAIIFVVAAIPLAAQIPVARLINTTRSGSADFQVGDHFEVVVAGAPNQPVSVRTMRQGRTDWGPVIGSTDSNGRWSTTGQFEKADFGGWSEAWTVGDKLANPVLSFSVRGPCLPGGQAFMSASGPNEMLSCDTAAGHQTFVTPSLSDPFRTPDGRTIPGRLPSTETAEQYHMEIMESMIMGDPNVQGGKLAAEAGHLILKMTGVNALSEAEIKSVLAIVRTAYEQIQFRAGEPEKPSMLQLLRRLATETDRESLKQEIAETIAFVQSPIKKAANRSEPVRGFF